MSKPYFRNVPNFQYPNRNKNEKNLSNYITVKNLFKRGKLREDIFENLQFFEKYQIIGDERPDSVAYKFYNDPTLDWVVLLANNILDVYNEWPLTQNMFDKVMLDKYGSYENLYSGIHHYETIAVKDSSGKILIPEKQKISLTWRTNGNFLEVINNRISQIFAGDGKTSSTTVTVSMNNGIKGLKVNDEVVIDNVVENVYNGRHTVTSIYTPFNDGIVRSFTYELDDAPDVIVPYLSSDGDEEVLLVISDSTLGGNSYYYEYYDERLGYYVRLPSSSFILPVTNYNYESEVESNKRGIYVLKPMYLNIIFNDLDALMPYKEGAAQYVSRTLKRGDNIRLYE